MNDVNFHISLINAAQTSEMLPYALSMHYLDITRSLMQFALLVLDMYMYICICMIEAKVISVLFRPPPPHYHSSKTYLLLYIERIMAANLRLFIPL